MAEDQLREMGIDLPDAPEPVAEYVPSVRTGNLVFLSGTLPLADGELTATGKVGDDLDVEAGKDAARQACLNSLAGLRAELGSLDRVRRIVRIVVHVNSADGFAKQHEVADGASTLLGKVFGEKGRHSRLALGAPGLPLDSPVELDLIAEVE